MIEAEKALPGAGLKNLRQAERQSTSLSSRSDLVQRLRRGEKVRERFVESHLNKNLAFQTRSLREREGWSQQVLAEKIGSTQNAVYRAENPRYGKQTLSTLKKIAAAFDVALTVRFVPFSELIDWASGTPRIYRGLSDESLTAPSFCSEEKAGVFDLAEKRTLPNASEASVELWNTHKEQRKGSVTVFRPSVKHQAGTITNGITKMLSSLDRGDIRHSDRGSQADSKGFDGRLAS